MSGKEEIIARVRQALGEPERQPETPIDAFPGADAVLPPIPPEQLIAHFEEELHAVASNSHRAKSLTELEEVLLAILPVPAAGPIVLSRNPMLDHFDVPQLLEKAGFSTFRWPSGHEVPGDQRAAFKLQTFGAAAGITGVDFALAESGTLALSSESEGSQITSLAPPVHIALYTRSQVVESLEEVLRGALRLEGGRGDPRGRSFVLITGPSRTSDIEQVSIKGVHGPTHLHAILVEFDQA